MGILAGPEGKIKSGTVTDLSFSPDFTGVALDNALHRGQPDACAFKFRNCV